LAAQQQQPQQWAAAADAGKELTEFKDKLTVSDSARRVLSLERFMVHCRLKSRKSRKSFRGWVYLRVDADDAVAVVAVVGEDRLVALDAVRMLVAQNVALPSQRLVALPAAKVAQVPILRHGFRVLAAKNQLHQQNQMKILDSVGKIKKN
jgi:hypothetical protein